MAYFKDDLISAGKNVGLNIDVSKNINKWANYFQSMQLGEIGEQQYYGYIESIIRFFLLMGYYESILIFLPEIAMAISAN